MHIIGFIRSYIRYFLCQRAYSRTRRSKSAFDASDSIPENRTFSASTMSVPCLPLLANTGYSETTSARTLTIVFLQELLLCAHSIPILLLLNQPPQELASSNQSLPNSEKGANSFFYSSSPPSRFLETHSCIRDTLNTKDFGICTFFRKVIRPSHEDTVGKKVVNFSFGPSSS